MSIIYYDKSILETEDVHPAMEPNLEHPCYRVKREAIDGQSVFHWTKEEAYKMYDWYIIGWRNPRWVTEFGDSVPDYDMKPIIKESHYMNNGHPSKETIEEMCAGVEMQKKMLQDTQKKTEE